MRRRAALLVAAPALLGVAVDLLAGAGVAPDAVLVLRVQAAAGDLAAALGAALSVGLALGWWLGRRARAARQGALARERRAQAEAHRRFVHRLDHELTNPLTAIRVGLANLGAREPAVAGGTLCNVQRQVDRLSRLVADLRKLADLESGDVERAPVDLAELVAEAVELARSAPDRGGRAIALRVQDLPWPVGPVAGDRDLLLLAVYNLLDNALKFSPPEAAVEVRAAEDGARAVVEVVDTGCGIAPDDLPHVAEELYRGRGTPGVEGSGLGLALVDRIAHRHGGELLVRSREGRGTVAALRLPLARR